MIKIVKYISYVFFIILFHVSAQEKEITFNVLATYGDDGEYWMGMIQDFDYYDQKLYILDKSNKEIHVYKESGEFIKKIKLGSGKGPCEFTIGLWAICVISDSLIAVVDEIQKKIEIITLEGEYVSGFRTQHEIHQLFYVGGNIVTTSNASDYIIRIYNLDGEIIEKLVPHPAKENLPVSWWPVVEYENGTYYYSNPYKNQIIKWNGKQIWEYNSSYKFIGEAGQVTGRYAYTQFKGWNNLCVVEDYLYVTTYDLLKTDNIVKGPQLIVLDKNTGEIITFQNLEHNSIFQSFNNGKDIFRLQNSPYPRIEKLKLAY